jgi:hypothetical protein
MPSKTLKWGPETVWSGGNTTTERFHAIGEPMPSAIVHDVRGSFDLRQSSGNALVGLGFQYSDDKLTWTTAESFGPAATASEGAVPGVKVFHLPALGDRKKWVRLGVLVSNDSGTEVEFATVSVRFDMESRIPNIATRVVDLSASKGNTNPNSMTFDVEDQGAGVYRLSRTGCRSQATTPSATGWRRATPCASIPSTARAPWSTCPTASSASCGRSP